MNGKKSIVFLCTVLIVSLFAAVGFAQADRVAVVQGILTDADGTPAADLVVRLVGPQSKQTTTNADGEFVFEDVNHGLYSLAVDGEGETLHMQTVPVVRDEVDVSVALAEVEEPPVRVNLFTPNIASVETNTTGFTMTSGTSEMSRDATRALHGDASLRVVGTKPNHGVWIASTFVPDNRATYTASAYIYGKEGDQFFIDFEEKRHTGTSVEKRHRGPVFTFESEGWHRVHHTATMEVGDSLGVVIRNAQEKDFEIWIDKLQLELGNEPTEWQEPVQTRNLFTYNQGTADVDTRGFIPAKGQGENPKLSFDPTVAWQGEGSLKVEGQGAGASEGFYMWSVFVPDARGTYTGSLYLKGTPGDRFYLVFEEKGKSGTGKVLESASEMFELQSDEWERFSFTVTMYAGQTLGFVLRHVEDEPFTVWVDGLQFEEGSAATRWVSPALESVD